VELTFDLIHAALDEAPEYSALSYTWGHAMHPTMILVNNQGLLIHANLHDALMHIATLLKGSERLLWVDAICINQQDLQERSSQVMIMRAIYERANTVGVWLGLPDSEVENRLAVKKMAELNAILQDVQAAHEGDVMAANTTISINDRRVFDVPGSECHQAWLGILSIMKKGWWGRTWIFQEATVPETSTDSHTWFFSGDLSFPWPHVAAAINIMMTLQPTLYPDATFVDIAYGTAGNLLNFLISRESGEPLHLMDLLQTFRRTDCTDPRDKVYAPLGLAVDVPLNKFTPDYSLTVEMVYRGIVEMVMTREGHEFDFLGYVVRTSSDFFDIKNEYEPLKESWIPDWRNYIRLALFPKMMRIHEPINGDESESAVYNAGGSLSINPSIIGHYLHVHGCHADTVDQLSSYWEDGRDPSNIKDWKPKNAPETYPTGETIDAALLRTIVADVKRDFDSNISRNNSMDWTNWNAPADKLTGAEYKRQNRMNVNVYKASYGRRLCWTRSGYVGITPAVTQTGDKICAFFGGKVLYVLRPVEPTVHEFVGECYVHGLMDGGILEWVKEGLRTAEVFKIA
jgi:hypothetical protein